MTAAGSTEANKKVPAFACAHGAETEDQALRPQSYLGLSAIIVSPTMQKLMQLVIKVAQSNATVLITGESGSRSSARLPSIIDSSNRLMAIKHRLASC